MIVRTTLVVFAVSAAVLLESPGGAVPPVRPAPGPTDHHVHVMSPSLVADWKSLGVPFSRPDSHYTRVGSLFRGPTPLGAAVLVPMGHLYGTDDFRQALRLSVEEEEARVGRENDYVAAEALRHGGKAVGLCTVPALRPYARRELERCALQPGIGGVKWHLASSGVDLRDRGHLEALRDLARWAEARQLPVLLHLDPQRRGTDSSHVLGFLRTVLEPHPRLTVVIAHLGGSGGYGPWTRTVFRTVSRWRAASPNRSNLHFDLSAVLLERESEGVPATTAVEAAQLAADLREAGWAGVVFGSDFPVFDPGRGQQHLRERLRLADDEAARIVAGVPQFFAARKR